MVNECYTAYPGENEIILKEGIGFAILNVEDVIIENKDS